MRQGRPNMRLHTSAEKKATETYRHASLGAGEGDESNASSATGKRTKRKPKHPEYCCSTVSSTGRPVVRKEFATGPYEERWV